MRKTYLTLILVLQYMLIYSQQQPKLILATQNLIKSRIEEIDNQGFEIREIYTTKDPHRFKLSSFGFFSPDSIFIEVYSVVKKRLYYSPENSIKIYKNTFNKNLKEKVKDSLITTAIYKTTKGNGQEIIDSWKTSFFPKNKFDPLTSIDYTIDPAFLYPPLEDQGTSSEEAIKKAKNNVSSFVIIVYSK